MWRLLLMVLCLGIGATARADPPRETMQVPGYRVLEEPDGPIRYRGRLFEATVAKDGALRCCDRRETLTGLGLLLLPGFAPGEIAGAGLSASGTLDLTDLVMRARGQDPYASERRAFAQRTERQRTERQQAVTGRTDLQVPFEDPS